MTLWVHLHYYFLEFHVKHKSKLHQVYFKLLNQSQGHFRFICSKGSSRPWKGWVPFSQFATACRSWIFSHVIFVDNCKQPAYKSRWWWSPSPRRAPPTLPRWWGPTSRRGAGSSRWTSRSRAAPGGNGNVHVMIPPLKGSDVVLIDLGELERDAVELLPPLSPELRVLGILGGARVHLDGPWVANLVIIQISERASSISQKPEIRDSFISSAKSSPLAQFPPRARRSSRVSRRPSSKWRTNCTWHRPQRLPPRSFCQGGDGNSPRKK